VFSFLYDHELGTNAGCMLSIQTATGSQALQDESVHLAAGMLLAGYRGVIGTTWSIMDNDAHKLPAMFMPIYWRNCLQIRPGQLRRCI
jgi:hypothetical protein